MSQIAPTYNSGTQGSTAYARAAQAYEQVLEIVAEERKKLGRKPKAWLDDIQVTLVEEPEAGIRIRADIHAVNLAGATIELAAYAQYSESRNSVGAIRKEFRSSKTGGVYAYETVTLESNDTDVDDVSFLLPAAAMRLATNRTMSDVDIVLRIWNRSTIGTELIQEIGPVLVAKPG